MFISHELLMSFPGFLTQKIPDLPRVRVAYGAPPGYHASQQLAAQVYEATGHRLATLPQAVAECPGYGLERETSPSSLFISG